MNRALLGIRSAALWSAGAVHFVPGALVLAAWSCALPRHPPHRALKGFCRNVVRLTGARFVVRHSPRFDPSATCLFVANHVNVFDPFVLCAAIPQPVRGFELESHFAIPVYGPLMRCLGNIPVPDRPSRGTLRMLRRRTTEDFARGRSLILFPEGTRTRTGEVGPFLTGILRLAVDAAVPLVPVTQAGAFTLQNPGQRMLRPATITVTVHDPIDVSALDADAREALPERLRGIVAGALGAGDA